MLSDTGRTDSLWMVTHPPATPPALGQDLPNRGDRRGDRGHLPAYLLARAGKRVVVLEDGAIGGGETGRTTAHLSKALDDRDHHLERLHK